MKSHKEDHKRSIVKAITFRILIMASDFIIIMAITKRSDVAFWVIIASNISSTIFYYFHERTWNKIDWGRK